MGNKIQFKRGISTQIPQLAYGEPGFVSDEGELYIGTEDGNIKLTSKSEIKILEQLKCKIIYGCKFDGITDDTKNLQNFINKERLCYLPAGTCLINQYIEIPSNTKIIGVKGQTKIKFKGDIYAGFRNKGWMNANYTENIILENLLFEYDKLSKFTEHTHAISFRNCKNIDIISCDFYNPPLSAIGGGTIDVVRVLNCKSYNSGQGAFTFTTSKNILIDGCYSENSYDSRTFGGTFTVYGCGIDIGQECENFVVTNNIIIGGKDGMYFRDCLDNGIISNNVISKVMNNGLSASLENNPKPYDYVFRNVLIDNNHFSEISTVRCLNNDNQPSNNNAIFLWKCINTSIINNTIRNCFKKGITLNAYNKLNTIQGNYINNVGYRGISIHSESDKKISILNNVLVDCGTENLDPTCAIYLNGFESEVINNKISATKVCGLSGIYCVNRQPYNIVNGNIIDTKDSRNSSITLIAKAINSNNNVFKGEYNIINSNIDYNMKRYGLTNDRPTSHLYNGFMFLDKNLNKPIWWNSDGGGKWIDANGTTV